MEARDIVLRMVELLNKKHVNLLDEVIAENYVMHIGTKGELKGLQKFKLVNSTEGGATAFPDFEIDVHDILVDGDKVAARYTMRATSTGSFMGHTATGDRVSWAGIVIHKIVKGKIVESWMAEDMLWLFSQLKIKDISFMK